MIARRTWLVFVGVLGLGGALVFALIFRYVPVVNDVTDPLGRPSTLANSVIYSSSQFDEISGVLVPKHAELTSRIAVLDTVADSLDGVVDEAGDLTPLAVQVNNGTDQVVGVAVPLPNLVGQITDRSKQATGAVGDLHGTIVDLTGGLQRVGDRLGTIHGTLGQLGPKADNITAVLAQIDDESKRIAPLGPVLGALGKTTNG
jgi:ABC-type transporter Mla subunit MlaD